MQFELLLTIFCVVFLTVLVLLFLFLLRQQNLRSSQQSEFLSAATELAIQRADQMTEALETQMSANQQNYEQMTRNLQAETQRQQELWQKSADLILTRALDGSNEAQKRASATLQSTLAMLGTKDPIAFSQVQSGWAAPIDDGIPVKPYTAVDDTVMERLTAEAEASAAAEDVMARLANFSRGTTDGSSTDPAGPRPYDFAAAVGG
jgi:hypothetical protein